MSMVQGGSSFAANLGGRHFAAGAGGRCGGAAKPVLGPMWLDTAEGSNTAEGSKPLCGTSRQVSRGPAFHTM